jgi:hypothetical protein
MPALRIKPGGINTYFDPVYGEVEAHSSTCSHCQTITDFPSLKRMFDHVEMCRGCMKLICLRCVGKGCRPYEKEAERQEREHHLQSQIHKQAWRCY